MRLTASATHHRTICDNAVEKDVMRVNDRSRPAGNQQLYAFIKDNLDSNMERKSRSGSQRYENFKMRTHHI